MKKAFTFIEIMVAMAIIMIMATFAMNYLLRSRIGATETSAQVALRTIFTAEYAYRTGNTGFGTLADLGQANPSYIERTLGCPAGTDSGNCTKGGYDFRANFNGENYFVVKAVPTESGSTGVRRLCITEDGLIREADTITLDTTHDECRDNCIPVKP
jgi:prepilin-type N-terminal cleavage/methylation domain-containing protein